ncbi:hypothetical protein MSAN_02379200 [Mycena sanguinolenta]|uniref:Uncharacterized protein n=1 Tax=Mycena sanguinolenta TaxID=230812 RepID=A0A8H6X4S7_9AGAR|nr:hypothetical protein MSAN_02379200 [Mycena sanguinolenta]
MSAQELLAKKRDPTIDRSNPNPIIHRASSTRTAMKSGEPQQASKGSPAASSGKKVKYKGTAPGQAAAPSTGSQSKPKTRPPSPSGSRASSRGIASPTAASAARHVHAPEPKAAPFGSSAPSLPSHMPFQARRGPATQPDKVTTQTPPSAYEAAALEEGAAGRSEPPITIHRVSPPYPPSVGSTKDPTEESDMEYTSEERGDRGKGREEGMGGNESITVALAHRRQAAFVDEEERFFSGRGRFIDLYKEPLIVSVARYHAPYNPEADDEEDPLLEFGAMGGVLPGMDAATSDLLRDAVIRYTRPHLQFEWTNLPELVREVLDIDAATVPIVVSDTSVRYYYLHLQSLNRVAHAVVALQQILESLTAFLGKNPTTSFRLDPKFAFLYMLEDSAEEMELRFALTTLQLRMQGANRHVLQYLRGIRDTLTGENSDDRLSSADSTISEVRREFGTQAPGRELAKLLLRKEYSLRAALIDEATRNRLVRNSGEEQRSTYYKPKPIHPIPTMREDVLGEGATHVAASSTLPRLQVPGNVQTGVRFVRQAPPHISAIRSLPGQGPIPNVLPNVNMAPVIGGHR